MGWKHCIDAHALPHACLCARYVLAVESHCKSMLPTAATSVSEHQEFEKREGGDRTGGGGRPAEAAHSSSSSYASHSSSSISASVIEQRVMSESSVRPHQGGDTMLSKTKHQTMYLQYVL